MTGRGAWTRIGMPANSTGFYQLLTPENVGSTPGVDDAHRAVMYGVKQLQVRINEMGYTPKLDTDGWFGKLSDKGARWAQNKVGVVVDGQVGPRTCTAMFWPAIQKIAGAQAHTVGGICSHESGFDPGAVGFSTPEDVGFVQINGPANPLLSEKDRFNYLVAFEYAGARIERALLKYGKLDYAIASYYSPLWADQWKKTGVPPNPQVVAFVEYVKNWPTPK